MTTNMRKVTIVTEAPTIEVLAAMQLDPEGVLAMAAWVKKYRPACVPEDFDPENASAMDLLPHDGREAIDADVVMPDGSHVVTADGSRIKVNRFVTDNELLAEFAGRKCYDSFAEKAAPRSNKQYLESMWSGRIPHRSTGYHPKMSFFIGDVSRRVSHELIRNYVGADRDEEGSPSQESTRFTHHYGAFIAPPKDLEYPDSITYFTDAMQEAYDRYGYYIDSEILAFRKRTGAEPRGMDRKRIYEAASNYLPHSCATSFIWTTNPMALAKLFAERCNTDADLEFQRFANKWKGICLERWPNLFPHVER